jgi:TatD DNase family protein
MPLHPAVEGRSLVPAPEPLPTSVIDAHTHLDACGADDPDDPNALAAAMDRAAAVGVTAVVTAGDDLESSRWAVTAAREDPRVYAAVGIHPTRADTLTDDVKAEIVGLATDPRVVAIGETGLDHYWDAAPHDVQAQAFAWHIALAKQTGKALIVHDREAHQPILDVLYAEGAPETVVFHCFSGDVDLARQCLDAGYLLSFAGPVTFTNAPALREAAAFVPADRLLVETDAPFLTPHPYRGRRNEPAALPYTVRALAAIKQKDLESLCESVRLTTSRIFAFGMG